jgi:hypothetical protein
MFHVDTPKLLSMIYEHLFLHLNGIKRADRGLRDVPTAWSWLKQPRSYCRRACWSSSSRYDR